MSYVTKTKQFRKKNACHFLLLESPRSLSPPPQGPQTPYLRINSLKRCLIFLGLVVTINESSQKEPQMVILVFKIVFISLQAVIASHFVWRFMTLQLVSFQSLSPLGAPFLSFTKKFGAHFIFLNFIYLFSQLFLAAQGLGRLSLVVASGGSSSLWCTGFSLQWLLSLRSMDWRVHVGLLVAVHRLQTTGTVVVAQGLSRSSACGIFPDQGWNSCPPNCKVDS